MSTNAPNMSRMAELVARIQETSAAVDFGPKRAEAVLTDVLSDQSNWLDPRYEQRAADRDWMLYPLYRAANCRCSILVAVFKPGVSAPVHNHGSWAVIGIYRGRERETWFRRNADAAVPGGAQLEVVQTLVNRTGTVTVVPDGMIHTVEALDGQDAVSIHIYGTDIVTQPRSTFDLDTGAEEIYQPGFSEPQQNLLRSSMRQRGGDEHCVSAARCQDQETSKSL